MKTATQTVASNASAAVVALPTPVVTLGNTFPNEGFVARSIPLAFMLARVPAPTTGIPTEWPALPANKYLPQSVTKSLFVAGAAINFGAEAVAGTILRGLDHSIDFVKDTMDAIPTVKFTKPKAAAKVEVKAEVKTTEAKAGAVPAQPNYVVRAWLWVKQKSIAAWITVSTRVKDLFTKKSATPELTVVDNTARATASTALAASAQTVEGLSQGGAAAVHEMFVAGAIAADGATQPTATVAAVVGDLSLEMAEPTAVTVISTTGVTMVESLNETYTAKFIERFDAIKQHVSFDPQWLGDDGNLDAMYASTELAGLLTHVGFQMKCVDSRGRKVIVTSTHVGPVIVYQTVVGGHQLRFHAPSVLLRSGFIRSKTPIVDPTEIEMLVGSADGKVVVNIGKSIAMLTAAAKD